MRVISGIARSIPLKTIDGLSTRPTTDRIKETLFNIIGPDISNKIFLDLFAGSGGIGIEALSRNASKVYFNDNNIECINIIKQNLTKTHLENNAIVTKLDCLNALNSINEKLDYIFMDPPYNSNLNNKVLKTLSDSNIINSSTIIIIESDITKNFDFVNELGYNITRIKEYKTNKHIFLNRRY